MNGDITHVERLLRAEVAASDGREVAPAVRAFMEKVERWPTREMDPDDLASITAWGSGQADPEAEALRWFAPLFAQGMQHVLEQYPELPGPSAVLIGHRGGIVQHGDIRTQMHGTFSMCHIGKDCYIMVSLEAVQEMKQMHDLRKTRRFPSESRQRLGELNAAEALVAIGAEEAYHVVQHQHPELSQRYQPSPIYGKALDVGAGISANPHDQDPRETDAVPVMEAALAAYRLRRRSGHGAALG